MANHEIAENSSKGAERAPERATYAGIAASSWNQNDMRSLSSESSKLAMPAVFGSFELIAQSPSIEAPMPVLPIPAFKVDYTAPDYLQGLERKINKEQFTHFYTLMKEGEHLSRLQEKTATSYGEPPAEAATKAPDRWNPSKGELNPLDSSSWTKLQAYAGDIGRANHWEGHKQFNQVNALRHALSSAYIAYHDGATAAIAGGLGHELHTGADDLGLGKAWSHDPKEIADWRDHSVDINNNLAGAKIAQEILDKGGSWKNVENAIVDAIKHHLEKNGRIAQPTHKLHTFLGS